MTKKIIEKIDIIENKMDMINQMDKINKMVKINKMHKYRILKKDKHQEETIDNNKVKLIKINNLITEETIKNDFKEKVNHQIKIYSEKQ